MDSPKYLASLSGAGDDSRSLNPIDHVFCLAYAATLPPTPPTIRQNVPYTEPLHSAPPALAKFMHDRQQVMHARPIIFSGARGAGRGQRRRTE